MTGDSTQAAWSPSHRPGRRSVHPWPKTESYDAAERDQYCRSTDGHRFLFYGDDGPDGFRLFVRKFRDTTVPYDQIIYGNRPSDYDLAESGLTAMASGAFEIHY